MKAFDGRILPACLLGFLAGVSLTAGQPIAAAILVSASMLCVCAMLARGDR